MMKLILMMLYRRQKGCAPVEGCRQFHIIYCNLLTLIKNTS